MRRVISGYFKWRFCLTSLILAALAGLALVATNATALTYIDGISDQSMPTWNGGFFSSPFASYFKSVWVPAQISYARYVVQWNAMTEPAGEYHYRHEYEAWLEDAHSMDLIPVLSVTKYASGSGPSITEYKLKLVELLEAANAAPRSYHISYVGAWNEPNNQGEVTAKAAAEYANAAHEVCAAHSCTVIAGEFEDHIQGGIASERRRCRHLVHRGRGILLPARGQLWSYHSSKKCTIPGENAHREHGNRAATRVLLWLSRGWREKSGMFSQSAPKRHRAV